MAVVIKSNEDANTPANSSICNPSMLTINTNTSSCPMPADHRGKASVIFTLVVLFFFFKEKNLN